MLVETMEMCTTPERVAEFLHQHAVSPACTYASLAVRKLRPSNPFMRGGNRQLPLRPDQTNALKSLARNEAATFEEVCALLSVEQLQWIGF